MLLTRAARLTFDSTGNSVLRLNPLSPDSPAQMAWVILPSQSAKTVRQTSAGESWEGITAGKSLKVNAQEGCFPSSRNYLIRPLQVLVSSRPRVMYTTYLHCLKKGIQCLVSIKTSNTWIIFLSKIIKHFHLRFCNPNSPRNECISPSKSHEELLKCQYPGCISHQLSQNFWG